MTTKPRWVECADEAVEVLKAARDRPEPEEKDAIIREAGAWMNLAYLYKGSSDLGSS